MMAAPSPQKLASVVEAGFGEPPAEGPTRWFGLDGLDTDPALGQDEAL